MALITATEVITISSPRNIDSGHILAADIKAAEIDLIKNVYGSELYNSVVENSGNAYDTLIADYIKPILAYGIIANNWNRLSVAITDRGINQLTGEGLSSAQEAAFDGALFEYRQRLSTFIADARDYITEYFPDIELLSTDYKEVTYSSIQDKRNNAL